MPGTDLHELPAITPGRYRHYKGGEYEVLGVVRHSESLEPPMLSRPLYGDAGLWVRPHGMFISDVQVDGRAVPRFAYLGPGGSEIGAVASRRVGGLRVDDDLPPEA